MARNLPHPTTILYKSVRLSIYIISLILNGTVSLKLKICIPLIYRLHSLIPPTIFLANSILSSHSSVISSELFRSNQYEIHFLLHEVIKHSNSNHLRTITQYLYVELPEIKLVQWKQQKKQIAQKWIEMSHTLPYTDLQSFLVESSDIISKVLLQQVRHLILQHFADLSIRFRLR